MRVLSCHFFTHALHQHETDVIQMLVASSVALHHEDVSVIILGPSGDAWILQVSALHDIKFL